MLKDEDGSQKTEVPIHTSKFLIHTFLLPVPG
jgi:hypothetical protein